MLDEFEIVRGSVSDWEIFRVYHYRTEKRLYFVDKVFLLLHRLCGRQRKAGIVVYSYPKANCRVRDELLKDYFDGFGLDMKMQLINSEMRRLSRVVVSPAYRGAGLATFLVGRTLAMLNMKYVDAVAEMGCYSGFLERAGMERVGKDRNYFVYSNFFVDSLEKGFKSIKGKV